MVTIALGSVALASEGTQWKSDSGHWGKNLAAMAAASMLCQEITPVGHTCCVVLWAVAAVGAQENEEQHLAEDGTASTVEKKIQSKPHEETANYITKLERKLLLLTVTSAICQIASQERYCLLYTSPSPRDGLLSRMPSSA